MINATRPQIAVITGGQSFDETGLHKFFRVMSGMDFYIQHMDDFATSSQAVRDRYDVLLFYHMLREAPMDDNQPWYAGKPLSVLSHLGETGQGICLWHHALVAYRQWPTWRALVGIPDLYSTFHKQQLLHIQVAAPDHPITQGLTGWRMTEETYVMAEPTPSDNQVLLTVDHPQSMQALAWTRHYKQSRVFCLQPGHDDSTWQNENFQTVMTRGLLWCAHKQEVMI